MSHFHWLHLQVMSSMFVFIACLFVNAATMKKVVEQHASKWNESWLNEPGRYRIELVYLLHRCIAIPLDKGEMGITLGCKTSYFTYTGKWSHLNNPRIPCFIIINWYRSERINRMESERRTPFPWHWPGRQRSPLCQACRGLIKINCSVYSSLLAL